MYVVQVIPIARGAFKEHLSFFSKIPFEAGVVVDAPVRGKNIPALVLKSTDAREEKLQLRDSDFALKKLKPHVARRILPESTIHAVHDIATYHALPVGAVLASLMPSAITNTLEYIAEVPTASPTPETASEVLLLQAEFEERVRMYRNIAREAFARGQSIVLVAPTVREAETLHEKLHRGIEEQVVLVTSAGSKKAVVAAWNHVVSDPEPLLVIVTPSFLIIPRPTIDAYIVERESARSYVGRERPFLDTRISAELLAKKQGARVIYADFPLRVETRARLEDGSAEELMRLQISSQNRAQVGIVDARKKSDVVQEKKKKFSVFTGRAEQAIRTELEKGGRVFLYTQRKGLAPLTVCNDCGTPVTDPTNGTPMTLHKTENGNVFVSFYSGAVQPANISCKQCGSWNLVSLGVGVERVVEEASKLFPDTPLFVITADATSTHAKAKKTSVEFFNTPRAVLVGTDRALPYLNEPIELSIVVSIDSLLSISAWRAHEYALATLFYIRDRTEKILLIQTRQSESEVMRALGTGNPTEFFRMELTDRAQFLYPPFATFIGLTWVGTEKGVAKTSVVVTKTLKGWDVVGPLPPRQVGKNRYLARAVIRLEKGRWPNERLLTELKTLPYEVAVTVNPDEIV